MLDSAVSQWHIQDTTVVVSISRGYYEIHGGATELIYPHHESHLAQRRLLTSIQYPVIGLYPFSKHYRKPLKFSISALDKFDFIDESKATAMAGSGSTTSNESNKIKINE